MSRLGKKPVLVPAGVGVTVASGRVAMKGPKGSMEMNVPPFTTLQWEEGSRLITVTRQDDSKQARANHGLTRSLVANLSEGVSRGFERRLQIYGTGYNCKLQGKTLLLNVGFSGRRRGLGAQFEMPIPDGLEVVVETPAARGDNEPAQFVIRGVDKQRVGQFAAEIRSIRKTEPYKGKGIRYHGEQIKKKQGKALSGSGG